MKTLKETLVGLTDWQLACAFLNVRQRMVTVSAVADNDVDFMLKGEWDEHALADWLATTAAEMRNVDCDCDKLPELDMDGCTFSGRCRKCEAREQEEERQMLVDHEMHNAKNGTENNLTRREQIEVGHRFGFFPYAIRCPIGMGMGQY